MAEMKDYITYPEDKGSIHISDEVVAKIAARAASETDGVAGLATNLSGEIARMFNKKGTKQGIRIEKTENDLTVEVFLVALSGYSLREVGENVQRNVTAAIGSPPRTRAPPSASASSSRFSTTTGTSFFSSIIL